MPLRTSAPSQVPPSSRPTTLALPSLRGGPLGEGSRGPEVAALQRFLKAREPSLEVDGDFGLKTKAAVRAFQRASRLDVDGVVGPQTLAAMARAGHPSPSGATSVATVRPGDRGPQVKELKTLLSRAGFYDGVLNDEFGPQGVAALRDAKRALG